MCRTARERREHAGWLGCQSSRDSCSAQLLRDRCERRRFRCIELYPWNGVRFERPRRWRFNPRRGRIVSRYTSATRLGRFEAWPRHHRARSDLHDLKPPFRDLSVECGLADTTQFAARSTHTNQRGSYGERRCASGHRIEPSANRRRRRARRKDTPCYRSTPGRAPKSLTRRLLRVGALTFLLHVASSRFRIGKVDPALGLQCIQAFRNYSWSGSSSIRPLFQNTLRD